MNLHKNVRIVLLLFSFLIVPLLLGYYLPYISSGKYNHIPIHAVVESFGSFMALVIGLFILIAKENTNQIDNEYFIGSALIATGTFDLFHASSMPSGTFVWLHSLAMLSGAIIVNLIWLREKHQFIRIYYLFPASIFIVSMLSSAGIVSFPDTLPGLNADGSFSLPQIITNYGSGLLYFIASVKFIHQYWKKPNTQDFIFALLFLLLSSTGLIFQLSILWDTQWWLWHAVRVLAYFVLLVYMLHTFYVDHESLRELGIQNLARLGVWELNLITNRLTWSDEIFHIFEIDKNHFGASYDAFLETIHPQDRERVNQAYTNSLITQKKYAIEHRLLMQDGRVKYVQEQCETFFDHTGRPLRSIGTVQDITKMHRINEENIRLKERYHQLFANSPDAYLILALKDGTFKDCNIACETLFQAQRSEIIGSTPISSLHHFKRMVPPLTPLLK